MQLQLRKLDISAIEDDQVIVFVGKRNTGKSFLVKDLLYYHRDVPIGTCVSATESANRFYGDIMPGLFIHDEVTPSLLDNVIKRQKMVISKKQKEQATFGSSTIDPRAFLILDDCLYDSSWVRMKQMRSIFMNGRHYKLLTIITSQYPLGITPNLRCNIDWVFILRDSIVSNRKRLYESYAGMFPSLNCFEQVMNACTENFECLAIHLAARTNRLEDQVFWYKADGHEQFKLGAREFWSMHERMCVQQDDDEEDDVMDASAFTNKKGPIISVKKTY